MGNIEIGNIPNEEKIIKSFTVEKGMRFLGLTILETTIALKFGGTRGDQVANKVVNFLSDPQWKDIKTFDVVHYDDGTIEIEWEDL